MIKASAHISGNDVTVKITVNDEETTWSMSVVSANFPDGCPQEVVELEALRRFAANLERGRNETLFDLFQTQEMAERAERLRLMPNEVRFESTARSASNPFIAAYRRLHGDDPYQAATLRITPSRPPVDFGANVDAGELAGRGWIRAYSRLLDDNISERIEELLNRGGFDRQ